MNMKRQKGFTLIELLIVIGIIAILAAAVIIAINPGRQFAQARQSTRQSHVASIANAFYAYAIDWGGGFPTDCIASGALTDANDHCGVITPTYMQSFPMDPGTDDPYTIAADGDRITITASAESGFDTITITQ